MVRARRLGQGEAIDPVARVAMARCRLLAVCLRHDDGGAISGDRSHDAARLAIGFNPNDKTNLAPYRLIHFVVLAFFINRWLARDWQGLEWPVFRPLIKCGQQSLEVFCIGVFLAVAAHVVLVEISDAIWMQIAVSALGITLMTVVAYYRSWSKNADKPKRLP